MVFNNYEVILTPKMNKEKDIIYEYISETLNNEIAAIDLINKVESELQRIKYVPRIYAEINLTDELKRRYRRIPIKNYIILYTIDEKEKNVYVSHMYYAGKNYFDSKF